jgi:hypothetical protein
MIERDPPEPLGIRGMPTRWLWRYRLVRRWASHLDHYNRPCYRFAIPPAAPPGVTSDPAEIVDRVLAKKMILRHEENAIRVARTMTPRERREAYTRWIVGAARPSR